MNNNINKKSIYNPNAFTVVGNPTITEDGIASGFTRNDYVKANYTSISSTWEIYAKIKTSQSFSENQCILACSTDNENISLLLRIEGNRTVLLAINYNSETNWGSLDRSTLTLNTNTDYFVHIKYDGSKYYLDFSLDKTNWTNYVTLDYAVELNPFTNFTLGFYVPGLPAIFSGQIDLKELSVIVDDNEVLSGLRQVIILNFLNVELEKHITWQYDNSTILKSLIKYKDDWYNKNLNGFWDKITYNFLDIKTATDWGLNLWGKLFQVKRLYNINGKQINISRELYRRLILGKLQLIHSNGTNPDINKYLNFIFSPYVTNTSWAVIVQDNLDMTITYIFNFEPTDEELALIYSRNFLPTPAGVEDKIYIMDPKNIFGFDGTGFQPWNQAPFWDGRYI